jgi:SacI restriction endonuclease
MAWAESPRGVPSEWTEWTQRVDASPSKTFTVALGTALLAKATNPNVDALALKATSGPKAYSARTVGHGVLVPGAVTHGYDLRATGREPLNNQPFFRYDRVDEIDRIHSRAKPYLPTLIDACTAINKLDAESALGALAAFLRVRLAAARSQQAINLRGGGISMSDLISNTERFIDANPEGGKRGQAFVAAAFDLASSTVRSARINDPSRRMPGDIQVLAGSLAVLAVEVRQKSVTYEEAMQFAGSLRAGNVATGLVAMLDPAQPGLDEYDLMVAAESEHGVFLTLAYGVYEVLGAATVWCGLSLVAVLEQFPRRMLERLDEIEASLESREDWSDLFSG